DGTPRPRPAYATAIPAPFAPRAGEILLLPEPRLFGTEELSSLSPPVAARVEAAALRIADDGGTAPTIALRLDGQSVVLPVIRDAALPPGIALCPPHMALRAFAAPAWAIVQPGGGDAP
ncbi:NADH-quinone oxidoreductase subunit NuoG, partial [Gluconacetobacter azotocaptans]|nr:NADH-quinone oxidoreductase subunit NuoG [Gluconacetobacter azotocaptans]